MGGGKMKLRGLLAMLIISCITLSGLSIANATDLDSTANSTLNATKNATLNNTDVNASNTSNSPVIKGYWIFSQDVASANAYDLKSEGITDIFVLTRGTTGVYHKNELQAAINKFHPYGIKVHAWIATFKDNGSFIDPSGYYNYTVKVATTAKTWSNIKTAYKVKTKVQYKSWYKKWYKSYGKWRYTWRYTWKYTWKYVTKYKYVKGWVYTPTYKYETRTGYNLTYNNQLIGEIASIAKNYDVDGIHLDYLRYSGVEQYGNAAYQQFGGLQAAVNAVTTFVSSINNAVNSTNKLNMQGKSYIKLSAALMPEGSINDDYYGQNYGKLADYLDFLVPMTYKGNYGASNSWITDKIQYIVNQAKGKPVYAGLTTYYSDDYLVPLSPYELQDDVNSAQAGGASGFVLFRYGFGYSYVPNWI